MAGNSIAAQLSGEMQQIASEVLEAQELMKNFAMGLVTNFQTKAIYNQEQAGTLIIEHDTSLIDMELKRRQAVSESAAVEETRNSALEHNIELSDELNAAQEETIDGIVAKKDAVAGESDGDWFANMLGMSDEQMDHLKQIGGATLEAFNSISGSLLEIKRRENEEKMALIDKELENTLGAIEKEREAALIAAGFAVENNAQSLEAQLEAAKNSGDQKLAYELERKLEEKAINDEFDAMAAEAERAAAEKKAKLEYNLAKQEHAMKLVDAVNAGAMAIIQAWTSPLAALIVPLTTAATAFQIAAIAKNPPKMPSFSTGGIVPGNSVTGDKIFAGLNSREMLLDMDQQRSLFNAIVKLILVTLFYLTIMDKEMIVKSSRNNVMNSCDQFIHRKYKI